MKYKRFTEKRKGKNVIPLLNSVCGVDLPKWCISEDSDIRSYLSGDAVDRLAELEDKIENGTLVELPRMLTYVDYYYGLEKYVVEWIDNGRVKSRTYWSEKKAEKKLKELHND